MPKYNVGAIMNMKLAPQIYPGWKVRFYCDAEATAVDELASMGAEIVSFLRPTRLPAALCMSWRYLAASDPDVDVVLFRDADSRLGHREKAAVDAWIASNKKCHVMHDHPEHVGFPIQGGMWGIRGGVLPDMEKWVAEREAWGPPATDTHVLYSFDDLHFLKEHVWPLVKSSVTHHTSVRTRWGGKPFPPHAPWKGFVGEQVHDPIGEGR
jgi:hypothetical protein